MFKVPVRRVFAAVGAFLLRPEPAGAPESAHLTNVADVTEQASAVRSGNVRMAVATTPSECIESDSVSGDSRSSVTVALSGKSDTDSPAVNAPAQLPGSHHGAVSTPARFPAGYAAFDVTSGTAIASSQGALSPLPAPERIAFPTPRPPTYASTLTARDRAAIAHAIARNGVSGRDGVLPVYDSVGGGS